MTAETGLYIVIGLLVLATFGGMLVATIVARREWRNRKR